MTDIALILRIDDLRAIGPLIVSLRTTDRYKFKRQIFDRLVELTGVQEVAETAAAWEEWYRRNGGKVE